MITNTRTAPMSRRQHEAIAEDAIALGLAVHMGGKARQHGNGSFISPTVVVAPRKGLLVALVAAQGLDVESGAVRPLWQDARVEVQAMHRATRVGQWDGVIDVLGSGEAILTIGGGILG